MHRRNCLKLIHLNHCTGQLRYLCLSAMHVQPIHIQGGATLDLRGGHRPPAVSLPGSVQLHQRANDHPTQAVADLALNCGCHHGRTFCFNSCKWHLYVAALLSTRTRKTSRRMPWTQPEKKRLCSVVCHVTYCCDRFLGSVNLRGLPSPYCAAEIGVQLSFFVHTQIQREKSFQTVSGRDEEAIEKLEGKDLFSPLASKSGGGSPPCRIACSTPGYNNCLCCNYARC